MRAARRIAAILFVATVTIVANGPPRASSARLLPAGVTVVANDFLQVPASAGSPPLARGRCCRSCGTS